MDSDLERAQTSEHCSMQLLPKYEVYPDFFNLLLEWEELGNLEYGNQHGFWVKLKLVDLIVDFTIRCLLCPVSTITFYQVAISNHTFLRKGLASERK